MNIVITQWALNAYLNLKQQHIFNPQEFNDTIKPDVSLLKHYPDNPKFENGKFWSLAPVAAKFKITGFKMKWHQIGNGKVQLRLPVAVLEHAFLCEAYVKQNDKIDRRSLAKFKTHMQLIQQNKYIQCGVI